MNKTYYIKDGYIHRNKIEYFDDTPNKDEYQNEIYVYAKNLVIQNNFKTIIDVGCGSGFKLIKYFNDFLTIGYDLPETVMFLKNKYPHKTWKTIDIENNIIQDSCDLFLCIDVIEHLLDPDNLIKQLSSIDFKIGIISTPERDLWAGSQHIGPPHNPTHVREWNKQEFNHYISQYFIIESHNVFSKHDQFVVIRKNKNVNI